MDSLGNQFGQDHFFGGGGCYVFNPCHTQHKVPQPGTGPCPLQWKHHDLSRWTAKSQDHMGTTPISKDHFIM